MEQATFRELILRDVDAKDAEDAIRQVGQRFYAEGFVKDTYIDAVVAREKAYATRPAARGNCSCHAAH